MHLGIEFTLEIREFGLRCLLKPPKEPMGNKQRMPIRAFRPHVGTDPVSVRLSLPIRSTDRITYFVLSSGADRHGVCPYMRANARVGGSIKPNSCRNVLILYLAALVTVWILT